MAGQWPDGGIGLWRQAFLGQQAVEGGAQVARGIGQGAVEVKQYCLDHVGCLYGKFCGQPCWLAGRV